jgi:DNA-binding GntR family transcriptional regulator
MSQPRLRGAPMNGRLATQIALRIVDLIQQEGYEKGFHLRSQTLADQFKVSRAPVTAALKLLSASGIVASVHNRGFFVARSAEKTNSLGFSTSPEDEDQVYFQIAEDHLSGRLATKVSENELMRQYGVSRVRVREVLTRAADEGWVERLPGHGWQFLAVLTSRDAYDQAYRFRAEIETAAVMQATFKVDASAFQTARMTQLTLLDGNIFRLSRSQLFQLNSGFHEMIVGCSGNQFFLDALRRINRLRRLMEYRITLDRTRLILQCREHLELLDLLEREDRRPASDALRRHIETALRLKVSGTQ